jgi:hypothetical protein
MLRTMISINKNLDLSKYTNLIAFFLNDKVKDIAPRNPKASVRKILKSFLQQQMTKIT